MLLDKVIANDAAHIRLPEGITRADHMQPATPASWRR
jgi:hypothetical protein